MLMGLYFDLQYRDARSTVLTVDKYPPIQADFFSDAYWRSEPWSDLLEEIDWRLCCSTLFFQTLLTGDGLPI